MESEDKKRLGLGFAIFAVAITTLLLFGPSAEKEIKARQQYAKSKTWYLTWVDDNKIKQAEIFIDFKTRYKEIIFHTKDGKKIVISQETRYKITNFKDTNPSELLKQSEVKK